METPLAGYPVKLTRGDLTLETTSDDEGAFRFDGLQPGAYRVQAIVEEEDNCFGDSTEREVVVEDGQTAEVTIIWVPGPC